MQHEAVRLESICMVLHADEGCLCSTEQRGLVGSECMLV